MLFKSDANQTKLCHAAPGDVIQFKEWAATFYLVCIDESIPKTPEHVGGTGLYACPHQLFLVDLQNGKRRFIPNLSTQVLICRHAYFSEGADV